jgi:hypothetical protein
MPAPFRLAQHLHSDTTGAGSVSGIAIEMYDDTSRDGAAHVVEAAGVPIVAYEDRAEATGVFYLLSALPAEALTAVIRAAEAGGDFPVTP